MSVPTLSAGDVHVWRARIERGPGRGSLERLLAADERVRAGRFRFECDAARYVTGRALARRIAATYLGTEPGRLVFRPGAHGKPLLDPALGLHCNWSHAGEFVAIALAGADVGVDIERTERVTDLDAVAERVFSDHEMAEYRSLEGEARRVAFFNGWTRKEAFIKATGEGMSRPLREFAVSLAESPVRLRVLRDDDPARWSLMAFAPGAGYAGAVAVRLPAARLRVMDWTGRDDDGAG